MKNINFVLLMWWQNYFLPVILIGGKTSYASDFKWWQN